MAATDRDDGDECVDVDGSLDGDADRNFNDTLFVELKVNKNVNNLLLKLEYYLFSCGMNGK